MTQREQLEALAGEIGNVIDRFRSEFDLPVVSVVGVLELHKANLLQDLLDSAEED